MSPDAGFRGPQVCKVVGITYRQLDYWARTHLIRPSIAQASGSGTQRRYSYGDVVELAVVKRLLDAGVELRSARRAIDYLRERIGTDVASATLVISGGAALVAHSDSEVIDYLRKGQAASSIVLSLGRVTAEIDAAVHNLLSEAS